MNDDSDWKYDNRSNWDIFRDAIIDHRRRLMLGYCYTTRTYIFDRNIIKYKKVNIDHHLKSIIPANKNQKQYMSFIGDVIGSILAGDEGCCRFIGDVRHVQAIANLCVKYGEVLCNVGIANMYNKFIDNNTLITHSVKCPYIEGRDLECSYEQWMNTDGIRKFYQESEKVGELLLRKKMLCEDWKDVLPINVTYIVWLPKEMVEDILGLIPELRDSPDVYISTVK